MNDLSEKEQIDEMRAWWAEYGRYVITGLVLGGAIVFGWNQWQSSERQTRAAASALYEQVMEAVNDGDLDAAEAAATQQFADYEKTVYPDLTRLALARLYMDKGRDLDAADVLREMISETDESIPQLAARARLAKILLYQNKPDEVVALLKDREASGYGAIYNEILGDAYYAQQMYVEAEAAYAAAIGQNQGVATVDPTLLQLKLNDLPDPTEIAALSSALEAEIEANKNAVEEAAVTGAEPTSATEETVMEEDQAESEAATEAETVE